MPLSQADRINFSQKIVDADDKIAILNQAIAAIQVELTKAQSFDASNKGLTDQMITLVQAYQKEYGIMSGNLRVELPTTPATDFESILQSSVTQVQSINSNTSGNLLYPNNPAISPPGIWTKTVPIATNIIQGKQLNESYPPTGTTEASLISSVLSAISTLQSTYVDIERSTGQRASQAGTCSLTNVGAPPGGIITTGVCTGGGGVWTGGSDSIYSVAAILTLGATIATAITPLQSKLSSYTFPTDSNAARAAQNVTAQASITTIQSVLTSWLGYSTNNTGHGQVTAAGFYAYNPNSLSGPLRYRDGELTTLINALNARLTFINSTRSPDLVTNLGSISQDGAGVVTGTGLYLTLYNYTALRMNMVGGSLFTVTGLTRAIANQNLMIAQANSEKAIYLTLLNCSALSAPSNATVNLHLKNASTFTLGQVYIKSESQPELSRTILSKSANMLILDSPVPQTYRTDEYARAYQDLT